MERYEIKVATEKQKLDQFYDVDKCMNDLVDDTRINLKTSSSKSTKKLYEQIWNNLLDELTKKFKLQYI